MRVLIAVAWPYASGPRHLGHVAGCYLPADIVARYHRLVGDEVLMVSGSDQHGTPITVAAEQAGASPQRFADEQHGKIAASFERLGISFDLYTKTHTDVHTETVQRLFLDLHRNGYLEDGFQSAAWCPREERSLPDRCVEGRCPVCGAPVRAPGSRIASKSGMPKSARRTPTSVTKRQLGWTCSPLAMGSFEGHDRCQRAIVNT
jgi:methionyl-tRNA synthetase